MASGIPVNERLIFALDCAGADEAAQWIARLGDSVAFYKIGLELIGSGDWFEVLRRLSGEGKRVFADLKLHDVPATVAAAVTTLSRHPIDLLTVHAQHPAMLRAAAAVPGRPRLLGVTVLTSIDADELAAEGDPRDPAALVLARAGMAQAAGIDGVVASGQEAAALRAALGPEALIVCPGIRPDGPAGDDQKRTVGVAEALAAGADHLVVGRPIRRATDPRGAARALQEQIAANI